MTTASVEASDLPPYTFREPCRQCRRRAPARLGMKRTTLQSLLKRLEISRPVLSPV